MIEIFCELIQQVLLSKVPMAFISKCCLKSCSAMLKNVTAGFKHIQTSEKVTKKLDETYSMLHKIPGHQRQTIGIIEVLSLSSELG